MENPPPGGGQGGGLTPGGGFFPVAEAKANLSSSKLSPECSTDCGLGMLVKFMAIWFTIGATCFLFRAQSKLEYLKEKDSFSIAARRVFCRVEGKKGTSHFNK